MAQVDERARHELYLAFENQIGPENTETLMSLLPPVGWADVATKQDLNLLRNEFRAEFAEFKTEMKSEFAEFKTGMTAEFAEFKTGMTAEFAELRAEMRGIRVEIKEELASWCKAMVVALGGLAISLTAILLTAIALVR